ncbi:MAG: GNAT family N-acetyltransferase, partial [Rhodobacteraceae bacterium]|nr:GNAT family N-acetyltransferase [Paracoccaceae bacterium]
RAPKAEDYETYVAFRESDRAKGVGGPYDRIQSFFDFCELVGHWVIHGYGRWMLADPASDEPLGTVGLMYPEDWPEPEIAWSLFENAEGRGLAFEAAVAARTYAYETLGLKTLISCTIPDNDRSIALAKRMGATYEGDFTHPQIGVLNIWRHIGPEALS